MLRLRPGEVDVWFASVRDVDDVETTDPGRALLLEPSELERMDRLALAAHRRVFLLAHTVLRRVLSSYMPVDPRDWRFVKTATGRPEILVPDGTALRFNLSHTAGLVGCAVTLTVDVGLDIEANRDITTAVAERFYAASEVQRLLNLTAQQRSERFFAYWTLKEAYIKARGLGFRLPVEQVVFDLDDGAMPSVQFGPSVKDDPGTWQFRRLQPSPRHIGAVAVRWPATSPLRVRAMAVPALGGPIVDSRRVSGGERV